MKCRNSDIGQYPSLEQRHVDQHQALFLAGNSNVVNPLSMYSQLYIPMENEPVLRLDFANVYCPAKVQKSKGLFCPSALKSGIWVDGSGVWIAAITAGQWLKALS